MVLRSKFSIWQSAMTSLGSTFNLCAARLTTSDKRGRGIKPSFFKEGYLLLSQHIVACQEKNQDVVLFIFLSISNINCLFEIFYSNSDPIRLCTACSPARLYEAISKIGFSSASGGLVFIRLRFTRTPEAHKPMAGGQESRRP